MLKWNVCGPRLFAIAERLQKLSENVIAYHNRIEDANRRQGRPKAIELVHVLAQHLGNALIGPRQAGQRRRVYVRHDNAERHQRTAEVEPRLLQRLLRPCFSTA